jgi:hypothetical protein
VKINREDLIRVLQSVDSEDIELVVGKQGNYLHLVEWEDNTTSLQDSPPGCIYSFNFKTNMPEHIYKKSVKILDPQNSLKEKENYGTCDECGKTLEYHPSHCRDCGTDKSYCSDCLKTASDGWGDFASFCKKHSKGRVPWTFKDLSRRRDEWMP